MKKLQEIDKLKMILLNEFQINLFDYIQKPMIPLDPSQTQCNMNQQYFSILRPIKTDYQRAIDAQNAFNEIAEHLDNPINVKLLNSIDKTIIDLLTIPQNSAQNLVESEDKPLESIQIQCSKILSESKSP